MKSIIEGMAIVALGAGLVLAGARGVAQTDVEPCQNGTMAVIELAQDLGGPDFQLRIWEDMAVTIESDGGDPVAVALVDLVNGLPDEVREEGC